MFFFFNRKKTGIETQADRRFLEALRNNPTLRLVDGAVYVDPSDEQNQKLHEYKQAARNMIERSRKHTM